MLQVHLKSSLSDTFFIQSFKHYVPGDIDGCQSISWQLAQHFQTEPLWPRASDYKLRGLSAFCVCNSLTSLNETNHAATSLCSIHILYNRFRAVFPVLVFPDHFFRRLFVPAAVWDSQCEMLTLCVCVCVCVCVCMCLYVCVSHRVTSKLWLITWKTLYTARPPYLSELITHYHPSRALRSSNTNLLARPSGITSNFTCGAFSVSAPLTWNSLHTHTRSLDKLSTFNRQLKSHLFQSTFAV